MTFKNTGGKSKAMSAKGYRERYKSRATIGIFAGIGTIAGFIILLVYALLFAGFFLLSISSFIFSLICMDAMTYYARTEIKTAYDKLPKDKQKEFLDTLPLADRVATIQPEPVGVFDHHEIRRSLTISLTIVYFALLSLSVFKLDLLTIKENPMVELFSWIYLAVIAFYFGSRGLEKYAEVKISKKKESEKVGAEPKEEKDTESEESVKPQIPSKTEGTIPVGSELSGGVE